MRVTGIGRNSVQGDIRFADVLEKMGAVIEWGDDYIACTRGALNAIDMDMNHIPDAAMTIATTALFAEGTTLMRNIYNWRVKETDRRRPWRPSCVKSGRKWKRDTILFASHRLRSYSMPISARTTITVWRCVSRWLRCRHAGNHSRSRLHGKTFPDYFQQLAKISHAS